MNDRKTRQKAKKIEAKRVEAIMEWCDNYLEKLEKKDEQLTRKNCFDVPDLTPYNAEQMETMRKMFTEEEINRGFGIKY